jgi:hypothetical protein
VFFASGTAQEFAPQHPVFVIAWYKKKAAIIPENISMVSMA